MFIITNSLFTWTLLIAAFAASSHLSEDCLMPNNENGTCVSIQSCSLAKQLINLHDIQYLQKITCGFQERTPLVCCPSDIAANPIQFDNIENATESPAHHTAPTNEPPLSTHKTTTETRYFSERTKTISTTPSTTPIDYESSAVKRPEAITVRITGSAETSTSSVPPKSNSQDMMWSTLPDRKECGVTAVETRIVGGDIAALNEFPWMAQLKYVHEESKKNMFACAGSLINRRYVLTVAHCLNNIEYKLIAVRLGEYNTEQSIDCDGEECNEPPLDVLIEDVRIHPKFSRNRRTKNIPQGDIALLRLNNTVPYTDFIRPICLPTTEYVKGQDYLPDTSYWTAGWGRTENGPNSSSSTILRKVSIRSVVMDICRVAHRNLKEEDQPFMICAGGHKGQDTCAGDSGGGLVRCVSENNVTNWFLLGMTSYGLARCGTEGIPSVYTRIAPYMNWILNNLLP